MQYESNVLGRYDCALMLTKASFLSIKNAVKTVNFLNIIILSIFIYFFITILNARMHLILIELLLA